MQVEVNYIQEATERDIESEYNVASDLFIPAMLYWNKNTKVDDINAYLQANYYYNERSVNSQGVSEFTLTSGALTPCLDIYGDDPDLAGFFIDTYANRSS